MKLCDSHTHIDQYSSSELPGILQRAMDSKVSLIIAAGTTIASSKECINLSTQYPLIKAGVGIHPTEVQSFFDDSIISTLNQLVKNNPQVVCMSETGMDYLPGSPDKHMQEQAFREQIRIGIENHKPIIFHSREAHEDTFRILSEEKVYSVGGIMHYFQGDIITALKAIELGCFISIARPLLRLPELETTVKHIPIKNIVLETDCYPQPFKKHRSSWTEPRHLMDIASKLAAIKGLTVEEVASITTNNLKSIVKF
tara:strand:- start:1817 stop:2581 length:765 start_codon:yes stop_codon:yes gene_type:complete